MNFFTAFVNSLKSTLLSLISGMSPLLLLTVVWAIGEAILLAVAYQLSLGLLTLEVGFGTLSAALIFVLDRYRTQVVSFIQTSATKLLS